jgi:hypothetical protein
VFAGLTMEAMEAGSVGTVGRTCRHEMGGRARIQSMDQIARDGCTRCINTGKIAGNNFACGYLRSTMQPEVFIFIIIHQLN